MKSRPESIESVPKRFKNGPDHTLLNIILSQVVGVVL